MAWPYWWAIWKTGECVFEIQLPPHAYITCCCFIWVMCCKPQGASVLFLHLPAAAPLPPHARTLLNIKPASTSCFFFSLCGRKKKSKCILRMIAYSPAPIRTLCYKPRTCIVSYHLNQTDIAEQIYGIINHMVHLPARFRHSSSGSSFRNTPPWCGVLNPWNPAHSFHPLCLIVPVIHFQSKLFSHMTFVSIISPVSDRSARLFHRGAGEDCG